VRLTTRIVVRALTVMALALGGVCLLTEELVRVSGRNDLDDLLREESAQLAASFTDGATDGAGLDRVLAEPEARNAARAALAVHPSGPRHVAVITLGESRLQATGGPPRVAALLRGTDAPATEPGRLRTVDTSVGAIRILDLALTDPSGAPLAVVTVAAPLDAVRDAANGALARSAAAAAVALVMGGAMLVWVVRRSLQPLRELSDAARAITPEDLTARVPVPDSGDEIQQLADELNEMLERIDADDRTRRRYLAAVSHEIRTPLTVAEGNLELIESGHVDPVPAAATVRHELDRMRRLLEDLLSVGRGGEEVAIRPGPIFLPDLFDALAARIEALGLAGRVRVEPAPPLAFTGDQARIEQCVSNLVHNAVDHNPPGTTVVVTARADRDRDTVVIEVVDTGGGIDPDLLPRVREPFVTSRPVGHQRASGLGLAVVDTLTRAQHGRLDLATGPTGTTATLTYPVEQPPSPEPAGPAPA